MHTFPGLEVEAAPDLGAACLVTPAPEVQDASVTVYTELMKSALGEPGPTGGGLEVDDAEEEVWAAVSAALVCGERDLVVVEGAGVSLASMWQGGVKDQTVGRGFLNLVAFGFGPRVGEGQWPRIGVGRSGLSVRAAEGRIFAEPSAYPAKVSQYG